MLLPNPQDEPAPAATPSGPFILDHGRADRAPPTEPPGATAGTPPTGAGGRVSAPTPTGSPFVLRRLALEGSSVPDRALRPVLARFVGRRIDAAGLQALAQAVSDAYGRTDVALYTVLLPQQDFAKGVVRVRVVEGYVEGVDVSARDVRLGRRIARLARPLTAERPLRRTTLDHVFLLVRSLPGVTVEARFVRGGADGAVRLEVAASLKRTQGGVGVGDRGANRLGRTQVEAELTLNGVARAGDRTTLTLAAPTDLVRFRYLSLTHAEPVGDRGLTVQGALGYLQTRPRGFAIRGEAVIASLQATLPVQLQADRSLTLTASLDALNSANALFGATVSDERTRTLRLSAAYVRTLGPDRSFTLAATLSQGVDGLGSRPAAPGFSDDGFHKLSLQAAGARTFGRWTVRARATAQATGDRLPASEQLALGGDDYGRAFASATVTGDSGAAASLELAWAASRLLPHALAGSEAYGFVDGGRVRFSRRPGSGSAEPGLPGATYDLASAGIGARVAAGPHAVFQLEASHELAARLPQGAGGDWRVVFGYRTNY